jgi:uncharacterized protein YkwD
MRKYFGLALLFFIISCQKNKEEVKTKNLVKKDEVLAAVNKIRKAGCKCGEVTYAPTGQVTWNQNLEEAALYHSEDMSQNNYFAHVAPNGETPADRVTKFGYQYLGFGENLYAAFGFSPTATEVVENWKNSQTHCTNLMNPKFKEMGVANFNNYWTQILGYK